ncbi:MAG TPA: hypothetical protein VK571_00985 [Gemmatimonadaceae bacterium]|nr:hypothetical protein [Gemmatimonadaceae bacterium]
MSAQCQNCPKTERKLAEAITIIERMLAAEKVISSAQRAVDEAEASLKAQRVAAYRWLEDLS